MTLEAKDERYRSTGSRYTWKCMSTLGAVALETPGVPHRSYSWM